MKKIQLCYPGFVTKAIAFSIDDGNLAMDKKFLEILAPHGIRGTFNLTAAAGKLSDPTYRSFYEANGVANHCKGHPMVFVPGKEYRFSAEPLTETNADAELLYPTKDPRIFHCYPHTWRTYTDRDTYYALSEQSRAELFEAFGPSAVKDFVWPHGEQKDPILHEMLKKRYRSIRKTGSILDSTGFSLPQDLHAWSYNAVHNNLLDTAALYENYSDDGELKFFSFGVHSVDYETNECFEDLRLFAERMGDRPDVYYYASVGEIFDYADAVRLLIISEQGIENPTEIEIYLKVDKDCIVLAPHTTYTF